MKPLEWAARALGTALLVASFFVAGCAQPPRATGPKDAQTGPWSGRLALKVQAQPPQSFSAGFELRGQASAGQLSLFNPLGGTVARLAWSPGKATLTSGSEVREFDSLDALVTQATGASIPVSALFDWLAGTPTPAAGWQADLSRLSEGRLEARREQPLPAAEMRVLLDR
ncbi:MAG: outer membrane lipoprotein LolB [Ramlibacter sp.]|nr:outer membrane lipoprotein LolB [Ramlibacter sp.]